MAQPKRQIQSQTQKQRIVWAIDPFEEKNEAQPHMISFLRKLASGGATIEPVYVLNPDEYDLNIQFNAPWLKELRPTVEKVVDHYVKDLKIEGLLPPQVVIEKRPSMSRGVQALVSYAKKSRADTIVTGTHARNGLPRFFLGSFAETLLLESTLPVLIVGPHAASPKIERILFATDLGKNGHFLFKHVIALAKSHRAGITLFHAIPHPFEPALQSGIYLLGGGFIAIPDFVSRQEAEKRKVAERYATLAKKHGVEIQILFEPAHSGVVQAVIACAEKEKVQLIAMEAESGSVSAALVGSITRQIVRTAPCPVWVLRNPK